LGLYQEALERLANLRRDLDLIRKHAATAEKLAAGVAEFETYIGNNQEPSRISASATGRMKRSARRSSNRRSIKW